MSKLPPITEKEPEVVYHYTSLSAMVNILRTQSIWASDISYLNDASERKLLFGLVDKVLPTWASNNNVYAISPFIYEAGEILDDGPFVASFSTAKDSLNQWRSYCPIANGVSIGFKSQCLRKSALRWKSLLESQTHQGFEYVPDCQFKAVSYVEPHEDEVAHNALDSAYSDAQNFGEHLELVGLDMSEGLEIDVDAIFRENVEAAASFYKHKGFQSEGEYRLLLPSVNMQFHEIKFRCTRSSMVPYVTLGIPHSDNAETIKTGVFRWDAVTEIIIGPTPNAELTQRAVWSFCRSIGLASASITTSSLPYRDW